MAEPARPDPTDSNKLAHMAYHCPGLGKDSRTDVRKEFMGPLLQTQQIIIPLFQRRYIWKTGQLKRWSQDLRKVVPHGLGQATFKWMNDEFICIDGQQRITTSLIFLASVFDAVSALPDSSSKTGLQRVLVSYLYTDPDAYHAWLDEAKSLPMDEAIPVGLNLPFSRLVPSYLDRRPFFQALVGRQFGLELDESNATSHQLEAKMFFDSWLSSRTLDSLAVLTQSLLEKFYIMRIEIMTPINMAQLFLWLQEKSLLGEGLLYNPTPGIAFGLCDLIRNLVMSEIMDQPLDVQERIFNERWMQPLERRFEDRFEELIRAFIETLPEIKASDSNILQIVTAGMKSGTVNRRKGTLLSAYARILCYSDDLGVERVLEELIAFAGSVE